MLLALVFFNQQRRYIMPRELSFVLDGKKFDHDGFVDPDIEADSYLDAKAGVILSFTDRKAFLKSFKDAGLQGNIQDAVKKRDEFRRHYEGMNDREKAALQAKQVSEHTAKQQAIRNLLKKKGVNPEDQKALLNLHKAGEIGSMIAYDLFGCIGDWAFFPPGLWPKLSWFGWNDRISGFYNIGFLASLHRHAWFCGKCLWVPPFARYCKLGWWNNRISSMIFYS